MSTKGQERMVHTKSVLYYSLLSALMMVPSDSYSVIKINNKSRSYADVYNQVNEVRASVAAPSVASAHTDDLGLAGKTEESDITVDLPIRVANTVLASQIARGESTSVTVGQLEKCGAVYPNGEFAWDVPTAGTKAGGGSQCVSVVEMRGYQMGPGGTDLVLGRINLAAGDSIKCNAFEWPNATLLPAAETIEFPNDAEPTVEDVIEVMNQEQKQHAGIKIAAATVLAAVAGNALGANEVGSDAILGTNKEKLTSTAVSGLTGAAIMAGNVYGGKVAGDMILSAGINAAAGGLIGNMAATGDSVLRIENCTHNDKQIKCLWGNLIQQDSWDSSKQYYYNVQDGRIYECDSNNTSCIISGARIEDIVLEGYCATSDTQDCAPTKNNQGQTYYLQQIRSENYVNANSYTLSTNTKKMELASGAPDSTGDNKFAKIVKGIIVKNSVPAVIIDIDTYMSGRNTWRQEDWDRNKTNIDSEKIKGRNNNGQPRELSDTELSNIKIDNFRPMYLNAEDGGLIDLDNKARLKGTLVGAGAGGAMGAFTAYQGAQDEIQQRWVTAVREYKDSLQKVYCATGNRFLTYYNDVIIIPNATE